MAYQMNIPLMMKVLRIGQEKLSDKGITSADKRVGPLSQQTDLTRDVIIDRLVDGFRDRYGLIDDELREDELAEAERRVVERFGTRDWIYFIP
jgi:lipoate-protein ligase A